jgi:hypothetical protein
MLPWEERPFEIANLLNPAFCSLLLQESIASYFKYRERGMPYPLAFLVLPLVLHKKTRKMLPSTSPVTLHEWINNHPEVNFMFVERTRRLVLYTKESLIFGIHQRTISISDKEHDKGNLIVRIKLKTLSWPIDSEAADCRNKARFVGRWFAQTGSVSTIFRIWRIRP